MKEIVVNTISKPDGNFNKAFSENNFQEKDEKTPSLDANNNSLMHGNCNKYPSELNVEQYNLENISIEEEVKL